MAESKKSTRRFRFSYEELEALADAEQEHKLVIFNKLTDVITCREKKRRSCEAITSAVNSVATFKQDVEEIRRKWKDWQSVMKPVKAKEQAPKRLQGKTGGGKTIGRITLIPAETKVIAIIEITAVDGIQNAIDSLVQPNATASKDNESHEIVGKEEKTKKINEVSLLQADIQLCAISCIRKWTRTSCHSRLVMTKFPKRSHHNGNLRMPVFTTP